MSQSKMKRGLTKVRDEFAVLKDLSWREYDTKIQNMRDLCDEKMVRSICLDPESFEYVFGVTPDGLDRYGRNRWSVIRLLEAVLPTYPKVGDKALRESEIDIVKTIIIEKGSYTDVNLIDDAALNGSGESQVLATKFCSVDVLRKLKTSKSSKVRRTVYERLGPVECLDDMLDDKIASIRTEGLARAPYYYDKLKQFTKEIARGPFTILVDKIPLDYLPMLMANRNVNNSWISKKFESRMSSGR